MSRVSTVLLACALALSVLAGLLVWREASLMGTSESSGISTASIGGPFKLIDQNGHVRTDKDFHGHFVLLYFGYTFCPDVCPTTLALMASSLGKLGAQSARITPVFITIDPARDTPAVLKTYLSSFGPNFVGLTGSQADVARIAQAYRIFYQKHPLAGGTYAMDHSSVIFLVDPSGRFVKFYDDDIGAAALADDLKKQL
jgi:protein SCO1/2